MRPYNDYRELCGLNRANSFADLINIPEETRIRLAETYDNIDDVDLFSGMYSFIYSLNLFFNSCTNIVNKKGGTSEIPIEGGVVGATFACIIGKQYSDLKRADRFFYENFNTDIGFTLEQLNEIRKVTMAQVLYIILIFLYFFLINFFFHYRYFVILVMLKKCKKMHSYCLMIY